MPAKQYNTETERQAAKRESDRIFNASGKGKARKARYRARKRSERVQVKSQEIRDDSGRLIAVRLPDGTIQAIAADPPKEE